MIFFLQLLLCLFIPWSTIWFTKRFAVAGWLSPIVLCYVIGILIGNLGFPVNEELANTITEVTILLAIPMLLLSTDIVAWLKHARSTILSFALCLVAVLIISVLAAFVFQNYVETPAQVAGMLVGVYTGGTPNMASIQLALDAPKETFVVLNVCDLFVSGLYLIFLTSIAQRVFLRFLPAFKSSHQEEIGASQTPSHLESTTWLSLPEKERILFFLSPLGITILIVALSLGVVFLLKGAIDLALLILLLTTFSIIASLVPRIRELKGAYPFGQYLLLIFSVAIGMLADATKLWESSPSLLLFTVVVVIGSILLHLLLAYLFKIDADTVIITSTAAIFGPLFVGQIADVLQNRSLIFSGMVTGLVGYAVGNYLGLFVAWLSSLLL